MALRFGLNPVLPAYCYLVAVAVPLSFIDARHKRLPDALTLPSYPVAFALLALAGPFIPAGSAHLLHAVLGGTAAGLLYLLLAAIRPADIGMGDVKLSGVLGTYLGWLGVRTFTIGIFGAFVLAGAIGLMLLTTRRLSGRSQLAFGPFMVAAAIGTIFISPA